MGVILVKTRLLKSEDSKVLSVLSLYIIVPCVIINAFQIEYTNAIRDGLLLAVLAAVLIHLVLLLLSPLLSRLFHLDPLEQASVIYSNAGNLIVPLVTSILGPQWVIYTSAYMSVQLILLWTHCRMLLCGDRKMDLKKIFLNVNLISILIGLLLFAFNIRLPQIISEAVDSISVMVGPLCMMVAGMLIGGMPVKQIFSYKRAWLVALCKMILCPSIILLLLKYTGLSSLAADGKTVLMISFLAAAAPSAATVTQMAQVYGRDADYASVIYTVTTLCCIGTMPLMVFLYQL